MNDCVEEVYFLLEEFPKTSGKVDKFVKAFFDSTIDKIPVKEDALGTTTKNQECDDLAF